MESRDDSSQNPRNAKVRNTFLNKAVVTASGHICGRWRKELVQPSSISGIASWKCRNTSPQECRNVGMSKCEKHLLVQVSDTGSWKCRNTSPQECQNAKKCTFWCRFRIPEVGVSKHFTTGMSKCWNVEMRKTPFGAGFRYRELEVSRTLTTESPKREMRNACSELAPSHNLWSHR
jgi:hypothetical protein